MSKRSSASKNAFTTQVGVNEGNSSDAEGSAIAPIRLAGVASTADGPEALQDTVQHLPGISVAKALIIWRDVAKYQVFLRQFADRYAAVVQSLRDAEAVEGQAIAHKFRGAAANLGLEDVAAFALSVEQSLKQGEAPHQALQDLQLAMTIALGSIARYAPPDSQDQEAPTPPGDQSLLAQWLPRLLAAWHSDSSSNVERALAERGQALPAESRALLQAALLNYDFRAGEAATAALMQSLDAGRGVP